MLPRNPKPGKPAAATALPAGLLIAAGMPRPKKPRRSRRKLVIGPETMKALTDLETFRRRDYSGAHADRFTAWMIELVLDLDEDSICEFYLEKLKSRAFARIRKAKRHNPAVA